MSEETPSTPAEQPADDLDTILDDQTTQEQPPETPEAEPAPTPEAKEPETPAPVVTAPVEVKAPERQPTADERRLAELDTLLDSDDFDPFSKEGRGATKEYAKVAARVEAEPIRRQLHETTIYSQLAEQYELPVKTLRDEWAKVTKDLAGKSQDVLDYEYERRLDALKAAKNKPAPEQTEAAAPSTPSKPRIPIKPANGNVAPPAGNRSGSRPPAPTRDAGEAFDKSVTSDDLASLV